jgi:hypothetical protein
MKLEKPPTTDFHFAYFQRILEGEFEDFLQKADENYHYWDKIKYRKDAP